MKDLYHNVKVSQVVTAATLTGNAESSEIDMQGYESLGVVIAVGQSGDTLSGSLKWTIKLQHSDASGSGFEDVTAEELLSGTASVVIDAAAEDEVAIHFGYAGGKRFVKAVIIATGTHTNGTPMAALALQGYASLAPVN